MNAIAEEEVETTNGGWRILDVGNDQQSADDEAEGIETPNGNPEEIRPEVQQEILVTIPPENQEEQLEERQDRQRVKLKMRVVWNLALLRD